MAVLGADLSLDPTPCPTPQPVLEVRGYLNARLDTVRAVLGEQDLQPDTLTGTVGWRLDTPAGPVCLSTSMLHTRPDVEYAWTIEALDDDVQPWLFKLITGSTASFPSGARPFFAGSSLESFTLAYVNYVHARSRAIFDRHNQYVTEFEVRQRELGVASQLSRMALEIVERLHRYQWSQADYETRLAWAGMPDSRWRGAHQIELAHWHEVQRWLFAPRAEQLKTYRGNPDLAGMLLTLADTKARHRSMLIESARSVDFEVYDENEQTLRSLATTPILGIDALTLRT